MSDINLIKIEPTINLPKFQLGGTGDSGHAGDGGQVEIITEEFNGNGQILAEGGDGIVAGKGGRIRIQSIRNNFIGKISVKGGSTR